MTTLDWKIYCACDIIRLEKSNDTLYDFLNKTIGESTGFKIIMFIQN